MLSAIIPFLHRYTSIVWLSRSSQIQMLRKENTILDGMSYCISNNSGLPSLNCRIDSIGIVCQLTVALTNRSVLSSRA